MESSVKMSNKAAATIPRAPRCHVIPDRRTALRAAIANGATEAAPRDGCGLAAARSCPLGCAEFAWRRRRGGCGFFCRAILAAAAGVRCRPAPPRCRGASPPGPSPGGRTVRRQSRAAHHVIPLRALFSVAGWRETQLDEIQRRAASCERAAFTLGGHARAGAAGASGRRAARRSRGAADLQDARHAAGRVCCQFRSAPARAPLQQLRGAVRSSCFGCCRVSRCCCKAGVAAHGSHVR